MNMIRNLSLRIKVVLGQVLLVAMVSVFIYTYYPHQQEKATRKAIESRIRSISQMFTISVGIGMGETDLVAVSEVLSFAQSDSCVVYLSITDPQGRKIASLDLLDKALLEKIKSMQLNHELRERSGVMYYGSDIRYQGASFGKMVIGYSLKPMENATAALKRTTSLFCLTLFASGVVLSLFMSNMITRNITKLVNSVNAISNGGEAVHVSVTTSDEIGMLGRAFNHMMQRLEKSRMELIRYSEQLKKQNEELNQFSYVVSHDLKAPLRAIFKLSEWIEEDLGAGIPQETKKNMQILRGRVFRLESLINGLLEYSKIGRVRVPVERSSVQAILREIVELLNPPPHIKVSIQKGMPVFNTKKVLLQQVFINLISNAIKYNDKPEGHIGISVSESDDFYRFVVEDNGMGIDKIYHERIFEIFQTLQSRDKVEGTGIGLAVIKKSVEDMGGNITVESEESKGARFIFTWPKAA